MSEAGDVAGECSQALKEAFKQETSAGNCALHVQARVLDARARVAHCLQVCGLDHHSPLQRIGGSLILKAA